MLPRVRKYAEWKTSGMDIPFRLIIPICWATEPYRVTAYYDQMRHRATGLRLDLRKGHADDGMK